ncbi:hypothetical protein B0F90DRAFT_1825552 [Multifurca ochricompacta]|uniref:Uncharacterized protein n=1 Tax=Multifurca ochricompacta TaxID=376703 RepID=A0AAD4LWH7_9AGAM|nr:hypothetical protein B0F90DRAFT_1825552 [Multifurca ochricompacta]
MAFDAPSPIPQLRLWLHAFMHVVSRLDRTHITLIEAIVLVSARPEYLSLVLATSPKVSHTNRSAGPRNGSSRVLRTSHSTYSL